MLCFVPHNWTKISTFNSPSWFSKWVHTNPSNLLAYRCASIGSSQQLLFTYMIYCLKSCFGHEKKSWDICWLGLKKPNNKSINYYRITYVLKVETDIITSILVILYVKTFNSDVSDFIGEVIMCLTSHWPIIFSIYISVSSSILKISLIEIKWKMRKSPIISEPHRWCNG